MNNVKQDSIVLFIMYDRVAIIFLGDKFLGYKMLIQLKSHQLVFTTLGVGFMKTQWAVSIRKTVLPGMAIPMLKIRRPNGRLIFNMEIAIRR